MYVHAGIIEFSVLFYVFFSDILKYSASTELICGSADTRLIQQSL